MQPLDTIPFGAFAVRFAAWSLLASGWVAGTVWVVRDALEVFGRTRPWMPLLFGLGIGLIVGTGLIGATVLPVAGTALAVTLTAYLVCREIAVHPDDRIVPARWLPLDRRSLERLPGAKLVLGWLRGSENEAWSRGPEGDVIILKRDGSPCGDAFDPADRMAGRALQAARRLLGEGVGMRATDVHFEPRPDGECEVRCRIDGIMQPRETLPATAGPAILSVLKSVGGMNAAERRRPQRGIFGLLAEGRRFEVRAVTAATPQGETFSARFVPTDGGIVRKGLGGLGMPESTSRGIRDLLQQTQGLLIVAGSPGAGTTTTAYTALAAVDVLTRNVVTIEDAIEHRLENVVQHAVADGIDTNRVAVMQATLRQDADLLFVDEIPDAETAVAAVRIAGHDHLVLATLAAPDAASAVMRLVEFGCGPDLARSAATAVLAQRLVRVLCPDCKQPHALPPDDLRKLGIVAEQPPTFFKEQGCARCLGTGYRGRTGVFEWLVFDGEMRSVLAGRPSLDAVRAAARKAGMRPLWQAALLKVCAGQTSLAEAQRALR